MIYSEKYRSDPGSALNITVICKPRLDNTLDAAQKAGTEVIYLFYISKNLLGYR